MEPIGGTTPHSSNLASFLVQPRLKICWIEFLANSVLVSRMFQEAFARFRARFSDKTFARIAQLVAILSIVCFTTAPLIVSDAKLWHIDSPIKFIGLLIFQFLILLLIFMGLDDKLLDDLNSTLVSIWRGVTALPWVLISIGAWLIICLLFVTIFNALGCILLLIGLELGIRNNARNRIWRNIRY